MEHKVHQGRNIKRFREMLGIKQEALAFDLGDDWNQKKVSLLEQKEKIDDSMLQKISEVLKIPVEAIQNFNEEQAISIITNTFNDETTVGDDSKIGNDNDLRAGDDSIIGDESVVGSTVENIKCTFNPIDKIVELYERMLLQQKEMVDKLENIIKDK
nr:helix-turn-helix transcriptional regulator [uncultured Chryseobacterium sp.]